MNRNIPIYLKVSPRGSRIGGVYDTKGNTLKKNREREGDRELVSYLLGVFEPSQPLRIISGLKETFRKRYIVERINKAVIRLEEQSEKRRVVRRIYGMKYS